MAAAQGRGRALGRQPRAGAQGPASNQLPTGSLALQPSPSFPQFGTWLDDATTADGGAGYASIGVSHWRGTGATQTDAPILGVTYGITNRAQLSATVPFYRASYEGFSGSGLDNVYVSTKISLVDPRANGRFGVALGSGGRDTGRRVRGRIARALGRASQHGASWWSSTSVWVNRLLFARRLLRGRRVRMDRSDRHVGHGLARTFCVSPRRDGGDDRRACLALPCATPPYSSRIRCRAVASVYIGGSRSFSDTWIDGASSVSGGMSFRFADPGRGTTE